MSGVDESIFRAYDIRGIYPGQINEEIAKKIAKAYVVVIKPEGEVAVGYDVRVHSKDIARAVREGLMESGVKVVDIGLVSTDMLYFAVGNYNLAGGIQVTASHNPAQWHGMKMVGAGVKPLTGDKEIPEIKQVVVEGGERLGDGGKVRSMDILDAYCDYLITYLGDAQIKPMKIVVNPNFGFAGKVFERLVQKGNLPIEIIGLNMELDGTFPKGRPDPLIPENRTEFAELVKSSGADLGITWDADADRVYFCAQGGLFVEPYYALTFFIADILEGTIGQSVVYDPRYTWALVDTIKRYSSQPVLSRVGHSLIKAKMRESGAIFGAESSGHSYYRDYWYSDSGTLPVMQLFRLMAKKNLDLAKVVGELAQKYPMSGEINRRVGDKEAIYQVLKQRYVDGQQSELDGLTVEYPMFRFNVRPSQNEPLFRLNLEAKTEELVKEKTAEVLGIIGGTEA